MIRKASPTEGEKLLIKVTLRVPASAAFPTIASWSYCVPAVVPPSSMFSEPVLLCV